LAVASGHLNLIGYLRVSSEAQDTQLQRDALTEAGAMKFFEDKISSRKTDRPGLAAALEYLRFGDILAVETRSPRAIGQGDPDSCRRAA